MTTLRALDRLAAPTMPRAVTLAVRLVGAALLLAMLAGLAVLLTPARWLGWVSLLAALLAIGTLGGLVLSLTVGLFGFFETLSAPLVTPTIVVESAAFVVFGGYATWTLLGARHRPERAGG